MKKQIQSINRWMMGATCFALCLALMNCLSENSSGFGFLTRNGVSEADQTTQTQNPDGSTTVVDTWQNLQSIAKKATIVISIDTSASLNEEIDFLADKGIKALVERFADEFETYFAVVGAYSNHPPYAGYNHGTQTITNTVHLSNGYNMSNPAGKLLPPNNLNQACVSVNDYSTTAEVVNAVKANFALKGSQPVGAGEAMINSVHELFTNSSLINPVVSAGKCFQNDHTIIVVSMSDETDYTLCPRNQSAAQNQTYAGGSSNGNSWGYWSMDDDNFWPQDLDMSSIEFDGSCGTLTGPEYPGDTIGALLYASYNSVDDKWEMNETVGGVEADLRAFAGTLPFFWAVVGYDEASVPSNDDETAAYAELALSESFSDDSAYHIPMQFAVSQNESAFSSAFDGLAEQLKVDASYLSIFDTQARCPGTTTVKVDGQTLNSTKYIELSLTRISIKSPHNQGSEVKIEYQLNTGPGDCD